MKDKCKLVRQLEEVGRIQLSPNFFLRDFLHSEIAKIYGVVNQPGTVRNGGPLSWWEPDWTHQLAALAFVASIAGPQISIPRQHRKAA